MSCDDSGLFEADSDEGPQLPLNGHSVTDATHPRFRRKMVRCKEPSHGSFPYNTLTKHFTQKEHKPADRNCPYCESDKIYEYFETSNPKYIKYYHNCATLGPDRPVDQGKAGSPYQTNKENASGSSHSSPTKLESEAGQYSETHSDAQSSGIGTACGSMVSVFSSTCDNNSKNSDLSNKSCNSSENISKEDGSPNDSYKN